MKKIIISLIASFMLCAFAYSESPPEKLAPRPEVGQPNKPDPVGEYKHLEKLIADKKAFAERAIASGAKFTKEGLAEFQAEIKALETRLDELKKIPEVVICILPPPPNPERKPFPPHWGKPPAIQTKDIGPLPGGFGMGSSTLAGWIEKNIQKDLANGKPGEKTDGGHPKPPPAPFRPKHPPKPELPEAVQKELTDFKAAQDQLRKDLKTEIDKLGESASKEDVKAVAEAFKAANKDRIDAQVAAGKALHEAMKDSRPKRGDFKRPEPSEEVKGKAEAMRTIHHELDKARHDLHKALKNASEEDRKALIATFRSAQKDQHQQLKEAKKSLREAIRDNAQTGDRRTED